MANTPTTIRGRGAAANTVNRFERVAYERDVDWNEPGDPAPKTQFYRDASASVITYNDSPDIGFSASIHPYPACAQCGLSYYARWYHEYLVSSAVLELATTI